MLMLIRSGKRSSGMLLLLFLFTLVTSAQAYELETLAGDRLMLERYTGNGQYTLVFYWSTDCPSCEAQKPMLEAFHQAHHDGSASVVGVVLDGLQHPDAMQLLLERHQSTYPNLVALPDVHAEQFLEATGQALRATPTYVLYGPDGQILGVRTGPVTRAQLDAAIGDDKAQ